MAAEAGNITALLKAWRSGDQAALDRMIPMVYEVLRQVASRARGGSGAGETMQTTALVNEAYMRLVDIRSVDWKDRAHFFAVSAQLMRRILIDSVRARHAAKRGGAGLVLESPGNWDGVPALEAAQTEELLAVDEALNRLAAMDPRRAKVVELRVFAGLAVAEVAEALAISEVTVKRDWRLAKAWLQRELGFQPGSMAHTDGD